MWQRSVCDGETLSLIGQMSLSGNCISHASINACTPVCLSISSVHHCTAGGLLVRARVRARMRASPAPPRSRARARMRAKSRPGLLVRGGLSGTSSSPWARPPSLARIITGWWAISGYCCCLVTCCLLAGEALSQGSHPISLWRCALTRCKKCKLCLRSAFFHVTHIAVPHSWQEARRMMHRGSLQWPTEVRTSGGHNIVRGEFLM